MLIEGLDGEPAVTHPAARTFKQEGFVAGALGLQLLHFGDDLLLGLFHVFDADRTGGLHVFSDSR